MTTDRIVILKESKSKVDDRMPKEILELTKPININYVEDRSYFEAEFDSAAARKQRAARLQMLDGSGGGGSRRQRDYYS